MGGGGNSFKECTLLHGDILVLACIYTHVVWTLVHLSEVHCTACGGELNSVAESVTD